MADKKAKINFYSEISEVLKGIAPTAHDCSHFTEYQVHSPVGSVKFLLTKDGDTSLYCRWDSEDIKFAREYFSGISNSGKWNHHFSGEQFDAISAAKRVISRLFEN